MTKWPVQNKHLEQHETRKTETRDRHKLRTNYVVVFSDVSILNHVEYCASDF